MKKLAFLGGAIGLGLGALLIATTSHAANHLDAPAVMTNPMADITDVYAWMSADASKVNLVMDLSPGDDGSNNFGPSILYTFHVTSWNHYAGSASPETKVICKFASNTSAQCWVGTAAYVTGDPSATAGITDSTGGVKLFAGRRSNPFFFNFNGFKDTVATVESAASTLTFDAAGCPLLNDVTGSALRTTLMEGPRGAAGHFPCNGSVTGTTADCFVNLDVMSIVLQIDKSLLNVGANSVLSVWGSTNSPG